MDKQKINPCPYLSCTSEDVDIFKKGPSLFNVECLDCGARGPANEDEERAITEWNLVSDTVYY